MKKYVFQILVILFAALSLVFGMSSSVFALPKKLPPIHHPRKPSRKTPHVTGGGEIVIKTIKTINCELVGKTHPITGVPFRGVVTVIKGVPTNVVVPQFEGIFTTTLPKHMLQASREVHFEKCTADLARRVKLDKTLAAKFTPRQLEQIKNGSPKIDGWTWHHTEKEGVMQLVDEKVHSQTAHTGGYSLWGAGAE